MKSRDSCHTMCKSACSVTMIWRSSILWRCKGRACVGLPASHRYGRMWLSLETSISKDMKDSASLPRRTSSLSWSQYAAGRKAVDSGAGSGRSGLRRLVVAENGGESCESRRLVQVIMIQEATDLLCHVGMLQAHVDTTRADNNRKKGQGRRENRLLKSGVEYIIDAVASTSSLLPSVRVRLCANRPLRDPNSIHHINIPIQNPARYMT